MGELRKLGKRGSYRLGTLGPPPGRPAMSGTHYPSFARGHRAPASAWALACLAATGVVAASALAGAWWAPFLAGLAGGLLARWGRWRLRVALTAVAAVTAAGWGAALAWAAVGGAPERTVAREIGALAGLPAHASLVLAVTLLVAVIQGVAGLWLGRALLPHPAR